MAAASHAKVGGAHRDLVPVRRALVSVFDKTGLERLGKALAERGVEILSTGGTAKRLRAAGLEVRDVSEHTGFPEILNGRVKSLHPAVHGGLLAVRGNEQHDAELARHGIGHIDLVVCNLYPFEATVAAGGDFDTCVENIDIGGPSMIRSGAKNARAVAVVTSPAQYDDLLASLDANNGATTLALRRRLSAAAFAATAAYDTSISEWAAAANV